jgi:hypothetical protein
MSMFFMTDDECAAMDMAATLEGAFPPPYPLIYREVMNTQLSVARFFGGVKLNGHHFTYFPAGDELIRDDVLKWLTKRRKAARKAEKAAAKAAQGDLI